MWKQSSLPAFAQAIPSFCTTFLHFSPWRVPLFKSSTPGNLLPIHQTPSFPLSEILSPSPLSSLIRTQ